MMAALQWGSPIKLCDNGRIHVQCKTNPDHNFWLTVRELEWSVCPHCAGWREENPRTGNPVS
jgi:hypothetical protein